VKSELLRLGVGRSEAPDATKQALRAVLNTMESERGKWILQPHIDARSEWGISGRVQDKLISGTVDRLFRDEQGRLWIIDFKTGEHKGRLETFLSEEQRRYREQLENYGVLMSRLEKGPIWLGLYFPLLDAWREWQLEEEAVAVHAR
ncbi:MAG: PD-(D/E)XK nuclease family protein, partial [Acidobacteriaceae bacterium]|nr:PD-(D/E)XK nuclease family protein [Acidobacteriaceae bacterium]